jgi:hypothetical protein
MRVLALFFLFVSALAQPNLSAAQKAQESQTKTPHKTDTSNPTIVVQCNGQCGPAEKNEQPQAANAQHPPHDWIDKLNAVSTGIVAAFTALLFGGIFYQVRNLRDVERAWFVVDAWTTPEELEHFNYDKPTPLKSDFTFKNRGRTPATITESSTFFGVISKSPGLPEIPIYRPEGAVSGYPRTGLLVVQSEKSNIRIDFMDKREEFQPFQLLEVRSGEALLVIYGFVRYSDAFRRKHEVRFCYIYHPKKGPNHWMGGEFKLGGPPAYNSHT